MVRVLWVTASEFARILPHRPWIQLDYRVAGPPGAVFAGFCIPRGPL